MPFTTSGVSLRLIFARDHFPDLASKMFPQGMRRKENIIFISPYFLGTNHSGGVQKADRKYAGKVREIVEKENAREKAKIVFCRKVSWLLFFLPYQTGKTSADEFSQSADLTCCWNWIKTWAGKWKMINSGQFWIATQSLFELKKIHWDPHISHGFSRKYFFLNA